MQLQCWLNRGCCDMSDIDERKVRLYQWMLDAGKVTLDRIPEQYRSYMNQPK